MICAGKRGWGASFTVWPKFKALFCYIYRIEDAHQTDLYIHAVTRCGTQGAGSKRVLLRRTTSEAAIRPHHIAPAY